MKNALKILVVGSVPAIAAGTLGAQPPSTQPASQPATQPSTQPARQGIADANQPLVIPDGTSRENPGPAGSPPNMWNAQDENGIMVITGVRG